MPKLSDLLPLVREKCTGMINQMALDQLKKAYRQFCIESRYIQRSETLIVGSDGSITLTPDNNHYVHAVLSIDDKNGAALTPGVQYIVATNGGVTITAKFKEVTATYSIVPLLPIANDAVIDGEAYKRWPDEIAAGAAALLLRMPNQEWTDSGLSGFYQGDFVKGHREAFRAGVSALDERQFQPQSKRVFF